MHRHTRGSAFIVHLPLAQSAVVVIPSGSAALLCGRRGLGAARMSPLDGWLALEGDVYTSELAEAVAEADVAALGSIDALRGDFGRDFGQRDPYLKNPAPLKLAAARFPLPGRHSDQPAGYNPRP